MFSLFKRPAPPPWVSAVVVCAGSGQRMEGIDKQLYPLDEIPAVVHSIQRMGECPLVAEVVVVCREADIAGYYRLVQDFGLEMVSSVVAGGQQRQDSVFAGIAACSGKAAYFAIHDGARPLVDPGDVGRCISAAMEQGAAALGVPVKDTIKVMGPDGAIAATPERSNLFAIQTPQVFEAEAYRRAMAQARHYRRTYTDDCQLVEQAGKKVFIVQGSYENIKITTPEDLAIAQAILNFRQGGLEPW